MPKITCHNCKTKKDVNNLFDGNSYCTSCYDELIFTCSCGVNSLKENSQTDPNGKVICEDCFGEIGFTCDSCNNNYYQDDLYDCDNCGEDYCQRCYDNDSCREENHQEQNQELEFQDGKKSKLITVSRYIGVELEAENGDRENISLPSTFGIKDDGSLDDETGVEIVTPPSKDSAVIKNVKMACEELNEAGFQSTSACGLHVHIDLRDIQNNFIKLSRILRTFFAVEDVMFAMLPDTRRSNHYCQPLREIYKFYDFYGSKVAKEFDCAIYQDRDKSRINNRKRNHSDDKRYTACNFHSTFFRGTLEVRSHSATQNPTKILNWIELLLKITDWSINHYKHSTVEGLLMLNATKKKVHKMQRIFRFSKKIEHYINSRIREFKHEGLNIDYQLGELPKRKRK